MKGVSYAYLTYNMVKQNSEEWVCESFDSIASQSDDIIVVDYSSDDNIKELSDGYDFRFLKVDKTEGIPYHDAKLYNKAIHEAKYDLLVFLTPDAIYEKNLTNFILNWYEKNDHEKYFLLLDYKSQSKDKKIERVWGRSGVYYRPFLLKIRGCDERTYIRGAKERGAHRYIIRIMPEVYDLEEICVVKNIHRWHKPRELTCYPTNDIKEILGEFSTTRFIQAFKENFDENIKNVVNSYW